MARLKVDGSTTVIHSCIGLLCLCQAGYKTKKIIACECYETIESTSEMTLIKRLLCLK